MSSLSQAAAIARSYGKLIRSITEKKNAERLRIAQENFDVGQRQIDAQAAQRADELSDVYRKHVGSLQANAAYRGLGTGGSVGAQLTSSAAQASVAGENIEINKNNAVGALAASSQIETEDAQLAEFQGAFQGLQIGSQFVSALASLPSTRVRQSTWVNTGLGWQEYYTYNEVPGSFNVHDIFPEFSDIFGGG